MYAFRKSSLIGSDTGALYLLLGIIGMFGGEVATFSWTDSGLS